MPFINHCPRIRSPRTLSSSCSLKIMSTSSGLKVNTLLKGMYIINSLSAKSVHDNWRNIHKLIRLYTFFSDGSRSSARQLLCPKSSSLQQLEGVTTPAAWQLRQLSGPAMETEINVIESEACLSLSEAQSQSSSYDRWCTNCNPKEDIVATTGRCILQLKKGIKKGVARNQLYPPLNLGNKPDTRKKKYGHDSEIAIFYHLHISPENDEAKPVVVWV